MKGRIVVALAVLTAAPACNESNDAFLSVRGVAIPNATCEVEPDPDNFLSTGSYDPRNGNSYLFTPNIENRLSPTDDNNQEFFEDDSLFVEGNSLRLVGLDVCYIDSDDERIRDFGSITNDGFPVDCEADSLPGEFIGSATVIPPGSNNSVFANVLSGDSLRSLYGTSFVPEQIPSIGQVGPQFISRPEPADAEPRDPNWGDFPTTGIADVFVIATAVAQRNNGDVIRSEPFPFVVRVIPGLQDDFCGPVFPIECSDGTMGTTGERPGQGTCSVGSGFTIQCEEFNTCPEATGG